LIGDEEVSVTPAVLGPRERALWSAQLRAEALFESIVEGGLLRAGILESELNDEIHVLARDAFGVSRHWHKRIVRSGENTLTTFRDEPPDRRIAADDVIYLDFGPVFGDWEADFGRTYALGGDQRKHDLVRDIGEAFRLGQALYERDEQLTAGQLYDYVASLATQSGWSFGNETAGHLVDRFPHHRDPARRGSIMSSNPMPLREPLPSGEVRHWILEIHFVDLQLGYGGFYEELLTVRGPR
jgi:peptidase M24-like protein